MGGLRLVLQLYVKRI